MKDRTTRTKTLTQKEAAEIVKKALKVPARAMVSFVVTTEYDPSDWDGRFGPDHVMTSVVVRWDDE